jgi:hypothetical protein
MGGSRTVSDAREGFEGIEGIEGTDGIDGIAGIEGIEQSGGIDEPAASTVPAPVGLASSGGLDSVISVGAFMLANRLGGLGWAIAASTSWSLVASYRRHRKGLAVGKLLPVTAAVLLIRGTVGIVTDSKAIYFGSGIAIQATIGVGLVVSALVGRSVLGAIIPRLLPFPRHVAAHEVFRSTMARLTIVAGTYELAKSGWDVWIYNNSSTNGFVLLRFLAGWLTGVIAITGSIVYADRRLKHIDGFDGMLPMLEAVTPNATTIARQPAAERAEP